MLPVIGFHSTARNREFNMPLIPGIHMYIPRTLCRAVAQQVHAAAPLMARHAGKAVLTGLAVPSDDLTPLTDHPA